MIRWDGGLADLTLAIPTFSDADLLAMYPRIDGEPENAVANALLAEIRRRELAI